jgi:hypothetical protein
VSLNPDTFEGRAVTGGGVRTIPSPGGDGVWTGRADAMAAQMAECERVGHPEGKSEVVPPKPLRMQLHQRQPPTAGPNEAHPIASLFPVPFRSTVALRSGEVCLAAHWRQVLPRDVVLQCRHFDRPGVWTHVPAFPTTGPRAGAQLQHPRGLRRYVARGFAPNPRTSRISDTTKKTPNSTGSDVADRLAAAPRQWCHGRRASEQLGQRSDDADRYDDHGSQTNDKSAFQLPHVSTQ